MIHFSDWADNLSSLGDKLWAKHIDPETRGGIGWRGNGKKIKWGILLLRTYKGMRFIR